MCLEFGFWNFTEALGLEWFTTSCGNASAVDEWTWTQSAGANAQSLLTEHWNT